VSAIKSPEVTASRGPLLRVAHVWRDEVMADQILHDPGSVTLGASAASTFVIPDLGLPADFAILRPGARGYVLTVGAAMGGQARLGGEEVDIASLSRGGGGERAEGAAGSFRATSVGPGDWGVIALDASGEHTLFFQFVTPDPPLPPAPMRDTELMLPALAFAILLIGSFVVMSYQLRSDENAMVFPGKRELMTAYLVRRPPPPPEPAKQEAAATDGQQESKADKPAATRGQTGKSGGEGEKPRARAPDPARGEPDEELPERLQVGFLAPESRKTVESVGKRGGFDDDLGRALARLQADTAVAGGPGGSGVGVGTGIGPGQGTGTSTRGGRGPGGGGASDADFRSGPAVDTGETRAPRGRPGGAPIAEKAVMKTGRASGDFTGLTREEIDKVVRARAGLIRACFQRELNRARDLGGTITVSFRIMGNGSVSSARVVRDRSSMRNAAVEDCITRQISNLKFPAKGGVSVVNYPFAFSQN
jgi:hypothetical protein